MTLYFIFRLVLYSRDYARIQEFSPGGGGGGGGGGGRLDHSDNVFSAYFTEVKWLISKKTIIL